MLTELNIKNIALIDSLRIEFSRGLNALTGETGTGKSIVVDCVNLALGHRGDRELVRTGEEKGGVKALFDICDCPQAKAFLEETQIAYDDDYAEVSREINAGGRGICRINGTVVPLATLKSFTALLVDLHGQQEHQKLMNPENHQMYLDAFGGKEIETQKIIVHEAYSAYLKLQREIKKLEDSEKTLSQRVDILSMQLKEINSAKLSKDEEEELIRRCKLIENSEKLSENLRIAYEKIYLGGKSLSAQESIKKAADALGKISDVDGVYASLSNRLEEILYSVRDIGYEIQSIYEELSFDPVQAERAQDRLELIKKLKRKYGPEVEDVIAYGKNAQEELDTLSNIDTRHEELTKELESAKDKLCVEASKLTGLRKIAAGQLKAAVKEQLADLGMGRTEFEVRLSPRKEIFSDGAEDIEFMISPNPGEPLRPLATIASGGEISRFMLALKVILAENDGIETMIFDEIDTGISGRMAQTVGEKMAVLGKDKQVICVTHLAQIASLADTEFMVEKTVENERTHSNVKKLDKEGRIEEIMRLVGGSETDESGREHAKNMLDGAEVRKRTLRGAEEC